MKIKTPPFWYRPDETPEPFSEKILRPFSGLYRLGYEIHQNSRQPESVGIPVICIGNLNAGGTGKTPTALALMKIMKEGKLVRNPYFLLRGYGGGDPGPTIVDRQKHTAWNTGDEALILTTEAPTIVSVDRVAGAKLAIQNQSDLVLMDDGLQNPSIKKDIKIIVINGEMGFGNRKMMPAGPLREPLEKGLKKADAFIVIGEDKRNILSSLPKDKPVFKAGIKANQQELPDLKKRYLAFAGLGYPEKFFSFLKHELHYDIAENVSFSDHHPYSEADLEKLQEKASALGASLLTTEKDFMRLPQIPGVEVFCLKIILSWENENEIADFLKSRLSLKAA